MWNSLPDMVCFSFVAGFSQSLKDVDLSHCICDVTNSCQLRCLSVCVFLMLGWATVSAYALLSSCNVTIPGYKLLKLV